jgi:hypothetical protein
MASEEERIKFFYENKSYSEREFDREFGYYTEKYPNYEYRIEITNGLTITEYVFNSEFKLEKKTYTLDELMSIMKNTYCINVYDREEPNFRKYTIYHKGILTGKGSQIKGTKTLYHPEDDGWIKHGICYEYFPSIIRIFTYKNGNTNGWEVEKFIKTGEITERLFEDSNCLGYRIKENGIITKNTISDEDFAKYGEPPVIEDAQP